MQTYYLGTHRPWWLWEETPPLCIPRQHLENRKLENLAPAVGRWMLDSGAFSELGKHGRWTWTAPQYVEFCREVVARVGGLDWVAAQDWMCEPFMVNRTGLSVREHLERTVANGLELRSLAPELPIKFSLQGYRIDEYLQCLDLYRQAGVDLTAETTVGIGSVCRRQSTDEIREVFAELWGAGLHNMHGFGVKTLGFNLYAQYLRTADSTAWSARARRIGAPTPGCEGRGHINCANCKRYALRWYGERMTQLESLGA